MTERSVNMESTRTDSTVLEELGSDLRRERLSRNLSQAELAREAGVTRDTVRRMEAGESVSTQTLVRLLRALGQLERIGALLPERGPGPLEQLDRGPAGRQRARPAAREEPPSSEWTWGSEDES